MRPLLSGPDADALPGRSSRHSSSVPSSPQMSCFITTEAALESADSQHSNHPPCVGRWPRQKRSLDFASQSSRTADSSPAPAPHSPASLSSSVLDDDMLQEPHAPMTPVLAGLSGPMSAISSSSSRRNSSVASSIAGKDSLLPSTRSSPRRSQSRHPGLSPQQVAVESPESQLIMPSLVVPPRRSFSEVGKTVGKLKISVTGAAGSGKTSLVRSIGRCCEHIVHIDHPRGSSSFVNETFASTKPQPRWRTELELSSSMRRRRSSLTPSDEVLDRNLCFVDTNDGLSFTQSMRATLDYVENQVTPLLYKSIEEPDLWSLLVSGSQPAVDVVLYMIRATGLSSTDIQALKALQAITNVVPVLARADELDKDDCTLTRSSFTAELEANGIVPFSFGGPNSPPELFAVSSKTQPDADEMDASTLMQSLYEQPLVQSDLQQLVDKMICAEGSAWLRHTAALKILKWCKEHRQAGAMQLFTQPSTLQHIDFGGLRGLDAYKAAQWWQRVEVTDWAQSLRRSLDSQSYQLPFPSDALELASVDATRSVVKCEKKSRKRRLRPVPTPTHQDPLGLLDWFAHARQGSKLTVELLSGMGIAAFITAWLHMSDSACHREVAQLPRGFVGWWWDIV